MTADSTYNCDDVSRLLNSSYQYSPYVDIFQKQIPDEDMYVLTEDFYKSKGFQDAIIHKQTIAGDVVKIYKNGYKSAVFIKNCKIVSNEDAVGLKDLVKINLRKMNRNVARSGTNSLTTDSVK